MEKVSRLQTIDSASSSNRLVMLLRSEIQSDDLKYKRCCKRNFSSHLTYEEAKNLVETLDEEVRVQTEYLEGRFLEDLESDEDLGLILGYINILQKSKMEKS